jgi:signal transduction histidine kinase
LLAQGGAVGESAYTTAYSLMTWVSYSFSAPAGLIMSLYFYRLHSAKPRLLTTIKAASFVPALAFSLVYHPAHFREYQLGNRTFWLVYTIYNLSYGLAFCALILRGIGVEKSRAVKRQKAMIGAIVLPPTFYVLITVYAFHLLELTQWFKAWQWNVFIVSLSVMAAIFMSFRGGFFGTRIAVQSYDWDSDMSLVGRGADYTNHMLKNQTSKMELCIDNLRKQYGDSERPEELAILSRSIATLKNYVARMARHSQSIVLLKEPCRIAELVADAMLVSPAGKLGVTAAADVPLDMLWECDKIHMTEVLTNIITNAAEAIKGGGAIAISAARNGSDCALRVADTGVGMAANVLQRVFDPYFTTKNPERNFGLGLSYCRNVVRKHGGSISVESEPGKGTVFTVTLPSPRTLVGGDSR